MKKHWTGLAALGVVAFGLLAASTPAQAGAVITNGSGIYLGVNDHGELNYTDGVTVALNTDGGGQVGVSVFRASGPHGAGLYDATSPGCLCEGWGAAAGGVSGYANRNFGAPVNLTLGSFASTASTATSVVSVGGTNLQVTHAYAPSASGALMQAAVTLTNTGGTDLSDVRYRRVMDWDVPDTEFTEYVTLSGWPATNLLRTSDDGFASANPLAGLTSIGCATNANFANCGAFDHGALFDFGFGPLAAGASRTFNIFYGAAPTETLAIAALAAVGAEVYSLGFNSTVGPDVPGFGSPYVYIFGFDGVGGTDVEPVPEPGTMLLLGSGLAGLALRRRRKA